MIFTLENFNKAKGTDSFTFVCKYCGKSFDVTKRYIQQNSMKLPIYCSKECAHNGSFKRIKGECAYCGKDIEITQKRYNNSKTGLFFCSNSCSAKYMNEHKIITNEQKEKTSRSVQIRYWKDKLGSIYDDSLINDLIKDYQPTNTTCPVCGGLKSPYSDKCYKCENEQKTNMLLERTLGDFLSDEDKYKTHKCSTIRKSARRIMENSGIEKKCYFCKDHEFDSIIEVHHIKGIMTFPLDAKIKEINDLNNLIWVCPNHHKMLEKGLIKL